MVKIFFLDTQINEEEYVRYKTGEYRDIHNEKMPSYMVEEARNEVGLFNKLLLVSYKY